MEDTGGAGMVDDAARAQQLARWHPPLTCDCTMMNARCPACDALAESIAQALADVRAENADRTVVLERAVGNCFMMAKREIARLLNMKPDASPLQLAVALALTLERWEHIQRFCETTGSKSSILRGQLPTEITEGAVAPPAPERREERTEP
jgi:metal-sulfur cluster biosynthetic enzyme